MRFTLLVLLGAFVLGCSTTVRRLEPRPNIALVKQQKSLALAFDPSVQDKFDIGVGNTTLHVESWRATLEGGFENGLRSAFPEPQGATADLTLQIDEAKLEVGDFEDKQARIRYAATLRMGDGSMRRTSGIASRAAPAFAGGAISTTELLGRDISASVEAMYEQLANELLASPAAAPPPSGADRCVAGKSIACVGSKGCAGYQVCGTDGAHYEPCNCD